MGPKDRRRSGWLVGSNCFHAVGADVCSRQSRSRRHVAGPVHDDSTLGGMGINCEARNAKCELEMVVMFLRLARTWISRQRTDCLDAVSDSRGSEIFFA